MHTDVLPIISVSLNCQSYTSIIRQWRAKLRTLFWPSLVQGATLGGVHHIGIQHPLTAPAMGVLLLAMSSTTLFWVSDINSSSSRNRRDFRTVLKG